MGKRRYTHVQELLPEIQAMVAEGKSQREIAEHYGFKDKMVVKRLLERERRKAQKKKRELWCVPKDGQGKTQRQEIWLLSKDMKSSG